MAKRLISSDAAIGKETWLHDNADGGYTIEQKQHFQQLLDQNKERHNSYEYGKLIGNTQRHQQQVAEIPNIIYAQLREKFGSPAENPKDWFKWLNDPDNRAFRTGGGRL